MPRAVPVYRARDPIKPGRQLLKGRPDPTLPLPTAAVDDRGVQLAAGAIVTLPPMVRATAQRLAWKPSTCLETGVLALVGGQPVR
jgi:hypothetical protein